MLGGGCRVGAWCTPQMPHSQQHAAWDRLPACRYQTCVHLDDIQPLYDVSGVQAYCINSRRAVLIHPKVRRVRRGEEVLWVDGGGDLKEAQPECIHTTRPSQSAPELTCLPPSPAPAEC